MGEIKSVKVDNWGVFFLQKLQNFFNKTDYCDLTLQFRDNSQLKVHRLVLSACTDYFNVLEQTCEIVDEALVMPNELQADVVVPIVNFMYTGTLEFELKMYSKLLRTAKEMNMTVLLKLLEAHRRTMEGVSRQQRPPSPRGVRRRVGQGPNIVSANQNQAAQRRIIANTSSPANQQQGQIRPVVQIIKNSPQQTGSPIRHQFGSGITIMKTNAKVQPANVITREIKQEPSYETTTRQEPASPFEQLRKGYNNNKRPPTTAFVSPPAKKPNLDDVKEFAEQQRMRKQIAAEFGEDQQETYDALMEDAGIHNDDDDDDEGGTTFQMPSTSRQQTTQTPIPNTTITIRHEGPDKQPTIIVKDSSNTKVNHAKIIQEVLKQYPHLVRGSKNIKLKILPSDNKTKGVLVKKDENEGLGVVPKQEHIRPAVTISPVKKTTTVIQQPVATQSVVVSPPKVIKQEVVTSTSLAATPVVSTSTAVADSLKKRIDSKTMHALIALGAENRTGPWLCLRCGVNNRPISIPSYRGFRRHLINTHREKIDPALCEHCGWRSENDRNLHFHIQVEHNIKSTLYTFEECNLCSELFEDATFLQDHMLNSHPDEKQQCIYCNKVFSKEIDLYNHMKGIHKNQAIEDGIIDETDEEYLASQDEEEDGESSQQNKDKKVQILSDITLQGVESPYNKQEHQGEATNEPKFVTADGSEVILTEEQRKQIMSQLNQDVESGSVVMFLNETNAETYIQDAGTTTTVIAEGQQIVAGATVVDGTTVVAATEELKQTEYDDSQIFEEMQNDKVDELIKNEQEAHSKESKESLENLEWAENLISAQEMEQEESDKLQREAEEQAKKQEDISKKLKELTGDWSEEEDDGEGLEDKEAKVDQDATKNIEESEIKPEESAVEMDDDIDLALQNLHREDVPEEEAAGEDDSQEGIIERLDDDLKSEEATNDETKMDVDEDTASQPEDEFLKTTEEHVEDMGLLESQSAGEISQGAESEEPEQEHEAVEHVETEEHIDEEPATNNNEMLLDDLINEASSGIIANAEAVAEDEIQTADTASEEMDEDKDKIDAPGSAETIEEHLDEDSQQEEQSVTPVEHLEEVSQDKVEEEAASTEEPVDPIKTSEKVKTLISDWAEDEDEEAEKNPQKE